jgi:hypothetical protein
MQSQKPVSKTNGCSYDKHYGVDVLESGRKQDFNLSQLQ